MKQAPQPTPNVDSGPSLKPKEDTLPNTLLESGGPVKDSLLSEKNQEMLLIGEIEEKDELLSTTN